MKKKLGILIALVMAFLLCLSPVVVSADTTYDSILKLENKDANWDEITGDKIWGRLEFNSSGDEFEYRFFAKGLESKTSYSLIYYADKPDRYVNWGGDNPGAVIADFTTNKNGKIKNIIGSVELDMSLPCVPDANYPEGAKIWLVPTDLLTDGELPMSGWVPSRILFECNLITYQNIEDSEDDPNLLTVIMRWGWPGIGRYVSEDDNTLRRSIEVAGKYGGSQYMLVIHEGCVIEKGVGDRLNQLFLSRVSGNTLTFTTDNVEFSEPCILYTVEGGHLTRDMRTWEWVGDGEWVEIGSFTSIVDREATLE